MSIGVLFFISYFQLWLDHNTWNYILTILLLFLLFIFIFYLGMSSVRTANEFACCPGKVYPDLTFTLSIRRKPLFYVVNLVIPCALISAMSMVEFILPCNSGEKVSLGITVLLSLTVFMLVVAENMPATSDDIPILGRCLFTIFWS